MNLGAFVEGAGNGYFAAEQEAYRRKRQAVADDRDAQRFSRDQQAWRDQDADRALVEQYKGESVDEPADWRGGLRTQQPTQQPMPRGASEEGNAGESTAFGAMQPAGGLQPPGVAAEVAQQPKTPKSQRVKDAEKALSFARTPAAFQSARKAMYDAKVMDGANAIASHVLWANDSEFATFTTGVSDGPNDYKIVPGRNGYSTMEIGDKKIQLDRTQVAQFLSAKYRLQHGDPTAMTDIAAVHKDLAGVADKKFAQQDKMVVHSNTAAHYRTQDDLRRQGLTQSAQQHKERQRDAPRELSPAMVKRLNELSTQIDEAQDPKVKAGLRETYNREYRLAATELGKVMPPERPDRPEYTQKDVLDWTERYTGQPDPDAPTKPMNAIRARQVAIGDLSGGYMSASDKILRGVPTEDPRVQKPQPAPRGLAATAPRGPYALPDRLENMNPAELASIPPGHPSYQPAQEQLQLLRSQLGAGQRTGNHFDTGQ